MFSNEKPTDQVSIPLVTEVPSSPCTRWRSRGGMFVAAGGLLLLAATGMWAAGEWWRSGRHTVPVPAIDFSDVRPAVRRAIESARHVVESEPQSGLAWGRLGMVCSAHEYTAESIVCFAEAQRLDRSDVRWPYLLAVASEGSDHSASVIAYREAIARRRAVSRGGVAVLPQLRLAELLLQLGQLDEATPLLNDLASAVPDDARVRFRMAQLLFRRRQLTEALSHVEVAHAAAPRQRMVAELLAQIRHALGETSTSPGIRQEAPVVESLETGWSDSLLEEVRRMRRDSYWRAAQAQLLIEQGDIAGGLAELEQAVAEASEDWTLCSKLARAYLQANRLDQAEQCLNRAVNQFPRAFDLFRLRGSVWLFREKWNEAVSDYRQALALKADDAASHADLGFCLQQIGDIAGAKRELLEALHLDGRLESARMQLANLLLEQGDVRLAREHLEVLLKTNPNHAAARSALERIAAEL